MRDRPTLALVAGWACPAVWMEPLAQAILAGRKSDYQLASIHQFGHDPASWRESLAHWLHSTRASHVVAWSMGAMAALDVLCTYPDLAIQCWILLAPTLRFCKSDDWPWGQPASAVRALRQAVRADPIPTLARFRIECARPHPIAESAAMSDAHHMATFSVGTLTEALGHLERWDLRPILRPSRRVLVLHGCHDAIIPVEAGRQVAERLGAKLVCFEELGHDMVVRSPARLARPIHECFDALGHD